MSVKHRVDVSVSCVCTIRYFFQKAEVGSVAHVSVRWDSMCDSSSNLSSSLSSPLLFSVPLHVPLHLHLISRAYPTWTRLPDGTAHEREDCLVCLGLMIELISSTSSSPRFSSPLFFFALAYRFVYSVCSSLLTPCGSPEVGRCVTRLRLLMLIHDRSPSKFEHSLYGNPGSL